MGGKPGHEWPDFTTLGATAHPSFGTGPIYRGRPGSASVLIWADQQSHDDLFTGRALTGDSGQHMQKFLEAMGVRKKYVILRVLPIDTLDLHHSTVRRIVDHAQVRAVYQAILDRIVHYSRDLGLILAFGSQSRRLVGRLDSGNLPVVRLKAWRQSGALSDWNARLNELRQISYKKEISNPSFQYDGSRGRIPAYDLPYGTLRWMGSSGDRGSRPIDLSTGDPSPDYYKVYMPMWAFRLNPTPLSASERAALAHLD